MLMRGPDAWTEGVVNPIKKQVLAAVVLGDHQVFYHTVSFIY